MDYVIPNESIGLVINLVSHHIRYDEDYIKNRNVDYVKLTVKGGGVVPTDDEFDAIVFAIDFDATTITLNRIDIRCHGDVALKDPWEEGPKTFLGMMSAEFPNLFMVTGPQSPSVLSNMIVPIEQHIDWISNCIAHMKSTGQATIAHVIGAGKRGGTPKRSGLLHAQSKSGVLVHGCQYSRQTEGIPALHGWCRCLPR